MAFFAFIIFFNSIFGNLLSTSTAHLPCSNIPRCMCQRLNATLMQANCSGLQLTTFPVFEPWVLHVDLSFNKIEGLVQSLRIPHSIVYLDISYNSIQFIEQGIITSLRRLRFLDISYNRQLNFEVFLNISKELPFTSMEILKFNGIHCRYGVGTRVYRAYVLNWNKTALREIHGSSNRIETIETNVIRSLPSTVEVINFSDNRFAFDNFFFEILEMPNIRWINISHQNNEPMVYLPVSRLLQTCTDKAHKSPHSFRTTAGKFISEGTSYIQRFSITNINVSIFLPASLEVLDVSSSSIIFRHLTVPMNVTFELPNLRQFYFQGNIIPELYSRDLIPRTVEYVDLSDNFCSRIYPWYFANGHKMKRLNLAGNILGDFLESMASSRIFFNQCELQYLSLSRNRIRNMNKEVLLPLRNLKYLDLSSNNIETVSFSLNTFQQIEVFDLSNNRIRFLSSRNIRDLDFISKSRSGRKAVSINLSGNTLQCTCETLKFLVWILGNTDDGYLHFPNMKDYKCILSNLTMVSFEQLNDVVDELGLNCNSSIVLSIVCGFIVVVFLGILIPAIFYRHRWRMRYFFFSAKRIFRSAKSNSSNHRLFSFDVFLSYADEDRAFVHDVILHGLESDEHRVRVCCHMRDFTAGRPIAENIADAIYLSRFTICVLSEHYLNSYWCMYEYNLAKMETEVARADEDAVILLLMNSFRWEKSPLALLAHIKRNSYLEIPPDNDKTRLQEFIVRLAHTVSGY